VKSAQIIFLSIVAACTYGVIHDQITVRLCREYFTVAHPRLFHTGSPTLLALCWGVAATAGIGAIFGGLLALVSQSAAGARPYSMSRVARSTILLLGIMGASACSAGVLGYQLSRVGIISLPLGWASIIPPRQHDRFIAVWFAHGASYLIGLSGGALLCFSIWTARGRPPVISLYPRSRGAVIRASMIAAVAAYVIWNRLFVS
jgi:hypothetical protein